MLNPIHNHPPSESPAVHAKHRMEEREMQRPLIERGVARGDNTKTIHETVLAAYPGTITQFQDIANMVQSVKKGKYRAEAEDAEADTALDMSFDFAGEMVNVSLPDTTPGLIHPSSSRRKMPKPDLTWNEELRRVKTELVQTTEISRVLQDRVDFLEKERGHLEWRVGRLEAALFQFAGQAMANGAAFAEPPPNTVHQPPQGPRWGEQCSPAQS